MRPVSTFPMTLLYPQAPLQSAHTNLIRAGLVLAMWDIVKNQVEDKVKEHFAEGFDWKGVWMDAEAYKTQVLSRNDYAFESSLLWLVEAGAVEEEHAQALLAFRDYRNKVAHEMPLILLGRQESIEMDRIVEIQQALFFLGRFWVGIDLQGDSQFGQNPERHVSSAVEAVIDFLVDTAMAAEAAFKAKE